MNWLTILPLIFKLLQAFLSAFAKLAPADQKLAAANPTAFDWSKIDWSVILQIVAQIFQLIFNKQTPTPTPGPNGGPVCS